MNHLSLPIGAVDMKSSQKQQYSHRQTNNHSFDDRDKISHKIPLMTPIAQNSNNLQSPTQRDNLKDSIMIIGQYTRNQDIKLNYAKARDQIKQLKSQIKNVSAMEINKTFRQDQEESQAAIRESKGTNTFFETLGNWNTFNQEYEYDIIKIDEAARYSLEINELDNEMKPASHIKSGSTLKINEILPLNRQNKTIKRYIEEKDKRFKEKTNIPGQRVIKSRQRNSNIQLNEISNNSTTTASYRYFPDQNVDYFSQLYQFQDNIANRNAKNTGRQNIPITRTSLSNLKNFNSTCLISNNEDTMLLCKYKNLSSFLKHDKYIKSQPSEVSCAAESTSLLQRIDQLDKKLSMRIHKMELHNLEHGIMIFGIIFNRAYCFISILITALYGYVYPERVQALLGASQLQLYQQNQEQLTPIILALFMALYNLFLLLVLLCITQSMKRIVARQRPVTIQVFRRINLTAHEKGTLSMPSGDTAQAALWVGMMHLVFFSQSMMIVVPLVALGRIYYQCHYIGDTFVGGMIGFFIANLGYLYFDKIAGLILPLIV
eukprot:403365927